MRIFAITNHGVLFFLKVIFSVLAVSFVVASPLVFFYSGILVKIFYTISAVWLGFFYFFLWAAAFACLICVLAQIFSFSFKQRLLAVVLFGLAMLIGIYGIINARNVRVAEITVALPNLPPAWQERRAVWISDAHLGPVRNIGFARRLADMANELKPDIVFIGGDLFDGAAGDLEKLAAPFGNIAAPPGVYFITGNHEGFGESGKYSEAARRVGMRALENETVDIDGLRIIGVGYAEAGEKENFRNILRSVNLDKGKPSILLKHSPFYIEVGEEEGISLQLSGHSHAGQIFPMGYITSRIFKNYDYGLKKYGNMIVYTSSGAGTWGIPMRAGSQSEIVAINFK